MEGRFCILPSNKKCEPYSCSQNNNLIHNSIERLSFHTNAVDYVVKKIQTNDAWWKFKKYESQQPFLSYTYI